MYLHDGVYPPHALLCQVHGTNVMPTWPPCTRECNGFAYFWRGTGAPSQEKCICASFGFMSAAVLYLVLGPPVSGVVSSFKPRLVIRTSCVTKPSLGGSGGVLPGKCNSECPFLLCVPGKKQATNAPGQPVHAMMPGIPGMQGHFRGPMVGQVCLCVCRVLVYVCACGVSD